MADLLDTKCQRGGSIIDLTHLQTAEGSTDTQPGVVDALISSLCSLVRDREPAIGQRGDDAVAKPASVWVGGGGTHEVLSIPIGRQRADMIDPIRPAAKSITS